MAGWWADQVSGWLTGWQAECCGKAGCLDEGLAAVLLVLCLVMDRLLS